MEKKTIYYIIGGIAILGIGYYFMNKGKKPSNENEKKVDNDSMALDSMTLDKKAVNKSVITKSPALAITPTTPTTPAPTKLTPQELESKLAGCGKKPKLKKNITLWNNCRNDMKDELKSQGLVAFDGSYSSQDNIVGGGFYSNFDNGLNLDL
jgi:hypothetical protein